MYEQTFKNIDDVLWKEAGCSTELDYAEQTSWLLFLKYIEDFENERKQTAEMNREKHSYILDEPYRWSEWAAPKNDKGEIDRDKAKTGDDLIAFVNDKLFPYLRGFAAGVKGADTIEYKIGEIFGEVKNRFQSGYSLRDALERVDELKFDSQKDRHELSDLYEQKIQRMGNAGRNGGEYYTPRPLIRAIVNVVDPKIGETVYDPACGSAGFLCEAFDYLNTDKLSVKEYKTLQRKTLYGKEKKSLPYIIAIMNLILRGVAAPNVLKTNTLAENLADIQQKDRHDVVVANPPFGGKERKEVQQNFEIKTGETAFLFLQHFIKMLKAGGRAGIVIKNTFLSNSGAAERALRKELLETCDLHTVLDLPSGVFQGAGVKTVVIFFEKGRKTKKVWYYQLDPGRKLGKTNPLNDDDLAEFVKLQKKRANTPNSWTIDVKDIDADSYDLSARNPNRTDEEQAREPDVVIKELKRLDKECAQLIDDIEGMIK